MKTDKCTLCGEYYPVDEIEYVNISLTNERKPYCIYCLDASKTKSSKVQANSDEEINTLLSAVAKE